MTKPAAIELLAASQISLLSVSPVEEDHAALARMLSGTAWTLHTAPTLFSALSNLRENREPVVLCERDLPLHTWKDLLDHLETLPDPPSLIVTSRLADERLWAEALSLGAYDVLAKPFDRQEVIRVVGSAWLHWSSRRRIRVQPAPAMRAAS